jgi:hypothetical protein
MSEDEALARLRALRAASYKCQAKDGLRGYCGRPAKDVSPLTAEGKALCKFHIQESNAGRRSPRLS